MRPLLILAVLSTVGCQADADSQQPDASAFDSSRPDVDPLDARRAVDAAPVDARPPVDAAHPDQAVDAGLPLDAAHLDLALDAARPADAQPVDQMLDVAVRDADPRSLADLWAPDFGPLPDDMPESIRWMHGRMWCPEPRPPRTMPDGTSECEHVDVPTPRDQLNPPGEGPWAAIACYGWPHRTSDVPYQIGDHFGPFVSCNPDRSLCCSFIETRLAPCGWTTCDGIWGAFYFQENPDDPAVQWLQAQGLDISLPLEINCPQDMLDAFPQALDNCHHQCKAPACE